MDSTLRTKLVYEVAESFEMTRSKISRLLLEHRSGKMEENGEFSYQGSPLLNPYLSNLRNSRLVNGKGDLEKDGDNTLIHLTICPNLILVFFILLIFPILILIAIYDNKYLMPGGKDNVWNIIKFFLVIEGVIIAVIILSTYLFKLSFERRFDLTSVRD